MNYKTQCLAVLFTTASAALAMACGPTYSCTRLAPVRERVIMDSCPYSSYSTWSEPSPSLGSAIGSVITAPFRLVGGTLVWTGRALGGGFNPAPVGERVIITKRSMSPVGERFITTQRFHHRRHMLRPVGEKTIVKKHTFLKPGNKSMLKKTTLQSSKTI